MRTKRDVRTQDIIKVFLIKIANNSLLNYKKYRSKYLVLGPGARRTFRLTSRTPWISFYFLSRTVETEHVERQKCHEEIQIAYNIKSTFTINIFLLQLLNTYNNYITYKNIFLNLYFKIKT